MRVPVRMEWMRIMMAYPMPGKIPMDLIHWLPILPAIWMGMVWAILKNTLLIQIPIFPIPMGMEWGMPRRWICTFLTLQWRIPTGMDIPIWKRPMRVHPQVVRWNIPIGMWLWWYTKVLYMFKMWPVDGILIQETPHPFPRSDHFLRLPLPHPEIFPTWLDLHILPIPPLSIHPVPMRMGMGYRIPGKGCMAFRLPRPMHRTIRTGILCPTS